MQFARGLLLAMLFLSACSITTSQPAIAPVQKLRLNVLVAYGGIDKEYPRQLLQNASNYLEAEFGVKLVVSKESEVEDISAFDSPGTAMVKLYNAVGAQDGYDLIFGFFPDRLVSTYEGVASADSIGVQYPSIAMARLRGVQQRDLKIVLHEIGHGLGASHSIFGVMFPEVAGHLFATGYSAGSADEIRAHLLKIANQRFTSDYALLKIKKDMRASLRGNRRNKS